MDPFSVAGSAVGVTSLALTVCQGLARYYAQFRSFHSDIEAIVCRTESLVDVLKALESSSSNIRINHTTTTKVAFGALQHTLNRLQKQIERCGEVKMPQIASDRARLVKRRLLWPFRRDTMRELMETLEGLQVNLMLTLQVEEASNEQRRFDDLAVVTNVLVAQNGSVENTLGSQTRVLDIIQQDVRNLSMSQNAQSALLSTRLSAVERRLESFALQDTALLLSKQSSNLTQAERKATSDQDHVIPRHTRPKSGQSGESITKLYSGFPNACNCHFYPHRRRHFEYIGRRWLRMWFPIDVQEVSDHLPSCPHYSHSSFSRTKETNFKINYTNSRGYLIRVGLSYGQNSGWSAISPVLRFRAIVPLSAPAFEPFVDLHNRIWDNYVPKDKGELKEDLFLALTKVKTSFCENQASPSDMTSYGSDIFSLAFESALALYAFGAVDIDEVFAFLDQLDQAQIKVDPDYFSGRHILYGHIKHNFRKAHTDVVSVASHVIQKAGSWRVSRYYLDAQANFDFVYSLLSAENTRNAFEEESPLDLIVLRRSEVEVERFLRTALPPYFHLTYEFEQALLYAIAWPRGLELLFSFLGGTSSNLRSGGKLLLNSALYCDNHESIQILFDNNIAVDERSWALACEEKYHCSDEVQRKIFRYLANKLSGTSGKDFQPYLVRDLTRIAAQSLWDAGYKEIDSSESGISPLRLQAILPPISESRLSVLEWFFDKKCSLELIDTQTLTTPAHAIGYTLAIGIISDYHNNVALPHGEFLTDILVRGNRDHCTCACSANGCSVLGCLVKRSNCRPWEDFVRMPLPLRNDSVRMPISLRHQRRETFILNPAYDLVDAHRDRYWLGPAILRVVTFEELRLTHTCCYRMGEEYQGRYRRPDEKERNEIQFAENGDIELLEELVTDFEVQWEGYVGSFRDFIKSIWRVRMDEVCGETSCVDEDNVAKLKEIGVVLDEVGH